jgi:hypothetical protein
MEQNRKLKSKFVIKKSDGYKNHKCITGLDPERDFKFNSMNEVELTQEEFQRLIKHRWTIGVLNGS